MCGLLALFSNTGPVPAETLPTALARLAHRGPDGQSAWCADHRRVALAHARLSIVDLIGGQQPLSNEDGTVRTISNGEFYGFKDIRQRLEKAGHRFASRSDGEILPHLYEELGFDCLRQLRGEFAFVLWDESSGILFAARDRFGIKPLYYGSHGGTLYIASEVKALFAAGVPARWDHDSVHQQMFACLASDRTLFAGVSQLPPGHYLIADCSGVRVVGYWDLDYPLAAERAATASEVLHAERLLCSLEDAIATRLRADVPIGCFLSGGIDSSAVLGIATRLCGTRLNAFTVGYQASGYDETPLAGEFATHCRAYHDVIRVGDTELADSVVDALWHGETLAFNLHGVARYLQCRRVHECGYKAVFSGEGADEILGGYGFCRHDMVPLERRGDAAHARTFSSLRSVQHVLGFVPDWLEKLAVNRSVLQLFLAPDFADQFDRLDVYSRFLSQFAIHEQLDGRSPLQKSLYLWNRSILPNYILMAERLEMAHAVEVRLPFLDHQLFEHVRGLPQELLLHSGREKYLLREAVRPLLTDQLYRRAKRPFTAPPLAAVPGSAMRTLIQDSLASTSMADVPFFANAEIRAFLGAGGARRGGRMQMAEDIVALAALSACVLQEKYRPSR